MASIVTRSPGIVLAELTDTKGHKLSLKLKTNSINIYSTLPCSRKLFETYREGAFDL
jgi:hypothetical protein